MSALLILVMAAGSNRQCSIFYNRRRATILYRNFEILRNVFSRFGCARAFLAAGSTAAELPALLPGAWPTRHQYPQSDCGHHWMVTSKTGIFYAHPRGIHQNRAIYESLFGSHYKDGSMAADISTCLHRAACRRSESTTRASFFDPRPMSLGWNILAVWDYSLIEE